MTPSCVDSNTRSTLVPALTPRSTGSWSEQLGRHGLEVNADSAAYLNRVTRNYLGELRPYVAIDFCELAISMCRYDGLPYVLDRALIDRVAGICFVKPPDYEERLAESNDYSIPAQVTPPVPPPAQACRR